MMRVVFFALLCLSLPAHADPPGLPRPVPFLERLLALGNVYHGYCDGESTRDFEFRIDRLPGSDGTCAYRFTAITWNHDGTVKQRLTGRLDSRGHFRTGAVPEGYVSLGAEAKLQPDEGSPWPMDFSISLYPGGRPFGVLLGDGCTRLRGWIEAPLNARY